MHGAVPSSCLSGRCRAFDGVHSRLCGVQPGRGGPPVREFLEVLNDEPDGAGGQEQSDHRGNGYQHRVVVLAGSRPLPPSLWLTSS